MPSVITTHAIGGGATLYEKITDAPRVKRTLIPPGSPTYNSDVEAFHGLMEREFYDMEENGCKGFFREIIYVYELF